MPEFLLIRLEKASNSKSNFPSMTRAMERIADVVEESGKKKGSNRWQINYMQWNF